MNYTIDLKLPEFLQEDYDWYTRTIRNAIQTIERISIKNGWHLLSEEQFLTSCDVFNIKNKFDEAIIKNFSLPESTNLPTTYSAVIKDKKLLIVSKEVYEKNYPEGKEANMYEKLVTHELAHELHIRLLGGNENDMGPMWFFEGFAIHLADQFAGFKTHLSKEKMKEIVKSSERGSYVEYGFVFRKILQKIPLTEFLKKSKNTDFNDFVVKLIDIIED